MSANEPFNGKTKWILWLAGIIFTIMFTIVTALANNMISNDKASRQRDDDIRDCISIMQVEIMQRLTRIETKIDR